MRATFALVVLGLLGSVARAQMPEPSEDAPGTQTETEAGTEAEAGTEKSTEAGTGTGTGTGTMPEAAPLQEEPEAVVDATTAAPVVVADPAARRFAVGAAQTLAGVRGLAVEFRAGRLLVEGIAGIGRYSPANGPSTTQIAFAAGAFLRWKTPSRVALLVGGRLALAYSGVAGTGGVEGGDGDSNTDVHLEAPLRVEIALGDRLTVHGEAGPLLSLVTSNEYVPGGMVAGDTTQFGISGGGLVAGFGFAWAL